MLHNIVGLPLLETEPETLVGIIFIVGLVLVVFDLDEVGVLGGGIKGEGDKRVDGGGLGDEFEGPGLRRSSVMRYEYA